MDSEDTVLASEFCMHHDIELLFINSLNEYGMIKSVVKDEEMYILTSELPLLERIVRLYDELDINLEGIETITHLLDRMEIMQNHRVD